MIGIAITLANGHKPALHEALKCCWNSLNFTNVTMKGPNKYYCDTCALESTDQMITVPSSKMTK